MADPGDLSWQRLIKLIGPIHESALRTSRRLARGDDEGDDVYHEALLRARDKLHTLEHEERFRSWFFAILLRLHRNRARRGFWSRFVPLGELPAPRQVPRPGDPAEIEWRARRLRAALRLLPAEQREAVVLFEVQGFSVAELAELLDVSPSAIKSRLSRGRRRLREIYERWDALQPERSTAGRVREVHDDATR